MSHVWTSSFSLCISLYYIIMLKSGNKQPKQETNHLYIWSVFLSFLVIISFFYKFKKKTFWDLKDSFSSGKEDPEHGRCKVKKRRYRQERLERAQPLHEVPRPYCTYDRSQRTRTIWNTCLAHQIHKTLTFKSRNHFKRRSLDFHHINSYRVRNQHIRVRCPVSTKRNQRWDCCKS